MFIHVQCLANKTNYFKVNEKESRKNTDLCLQVLAKFNKFTSLFL